MYVGKNGDGKLVIFIDDLDRCIPSNAITVLEALKIFLGKRKCVFVIGVDQGSLEHAVDSVYGVEKGLPGRDYLAKIVQVPFYMPEMAPTFPIGAVAPWLAPQYIGKTVHAIIEIATEGNPRQIKRFNNTFVLANRVLGAETSETDRILLAIFGRNLCEISGFP